MRKVRRKPPDIKAMVTDFLRKCLALAPDTALRTSEIANGLGLENPRTWQTLDELHALHLVERYPKKRGGLKYLRHERTRKAYFPPDGAERIFSECVDQLLRLAKASPKILTILGCTLEDIQNLDLSQLNVYNAWVGQLKRLGVNGSLSKLSWETIAVRWWLA